MASMTPFECPICFEYYGYGDTTPTTFPCGHSCCLKHAPHLSGYCFSCRIPLPRLSILKESISLRDGAELYFSSQKSLQKIQEEKQTGETVLYATVVEDVFDAPTSRFPSQPADTITTHAILDIPADQSAQSTLNTTYNTTQRNTVDTTAATTTTTTKFCQKCETSKPFTSFSKKERGKSPATCHLCLKKIKNKGTTGHVVMKCGHSCEMTHTTKHCCACIDKRPELKCYPVYVDGVGHVNSSSRNHNYCPTCCKTRSVLSSGPFGRLPKSCGHHCEMSIDGCCACLDKRPVLKGNRYPVYVDGVGHQNTGTRGQDYCPSCRY